MTASITPSPHSCRFWAGEIGTAQGGERRGSGVRCANPGNAPGYITSPLTLGELEQLLVDGIAAARRRSTDETAMILRTATDNATHSLGMSVPVSSLDAVSEGFVPGWENRPRSCSRRARPSVPNAPLASVTGAVNTVSQHLTTDMVFRTTSQVMDAVNTFADGRGVQRARRKPAPRRGTSHPGRVRSSRIIWRISSESSL